MGLELENEESLELLMWQLKSSMLKSRNAFFFVYIKHENLKLMKFN